MCGLRDKIDRYMDKRVEVRKTGGWGKWMVGKYVDRIMVR